MSINMAVVGSREKYWAEMSNPKEYVYGIISKYLDHFNAKTTIISGGSPAGGVDTWAREYAIDHEIPFKEYYPHYTLPSPECYYVRNREIVDASHIIIAILAPNKTLSSSGTAYTVRYAKEKRKIIYIVDVNGHTIIS